MNVKVKYKIYVIGLFSLILFVITTFTVFDITYFGYVNKIEESDVKRSFKVINYIIQNEEREIKITIEEWSKWDYTYEFIENSNKEYIYSNLNKDTFNNLNLSSMIFLNNNNEIVYEKDYITKINDIKILKNEIISQIKITNKSGNINTGLLFAKNKLFMVAIAPITKLADSKIKNGHLIFVRAIESGLLEYIRLISRVKFKFKHLEENKKNYTAINKKVGKSDDENNIRYYKLIKDANHKGTIIFEIANKYNNDKGYYFKFFVISFMLITIIVIVLDFFIVNKYILKKLIKLHEFTNKVAMTKDTSLTITMEGKDEYYELAVSINKMIKALNSAYNESSEISERFMLTMEATNDGILDFYIKNYKIYISPHWKEMIGLGELDGYDLYNKYISRVHPECCKRIKDEFFKILDGEIDFFNKQYRLVTDSGEIIWILHRGRIMEKDENGKPIRIISTLTNITNRKNYEEEIIFLSYSDKLTGLKNRAYMEKLFTDLDKEKSEKYFIIIIDINGLKATNDTFGYKEGNKLIIYLSKILLDNCDSDDFISRWGGDEFIILVKNKEETYISNLILKIKDDCKNVYELNFEVSIALGYAGKK